MMNLPNSLRALDRGELTFDDLVAQFNDATFSLPKSRKGRTAAEVYTSAEEDDATNVPEQLARASFAGYISDAQEQQLLGIYNSRV